MDNSTGGFTALVLGVIFILLACFGATWFFTRGIVHEEVNKFAYITDQYEGSKMLVENKVQDDGNGYFMELEDGSTSYIVVKGKDGKYTHTEEKMSDKTIALNEMMTESIKRKNAPKNDIVSYIPIFFPM